jgi:hypothetical protein
MVAMVSRLPAAFRALAPRSRRQTPFGVALVLAMVLSAGLLAGCGGGFYVAIGDDDVDDRTPPSVSLAAAAASVPAGQALRLVAAAADDRGIDRVVFYRVDNGGNTLLGSDGAAPYEWNATVPSDGRTSVSFFTHAEDRSGNAADSTTVTVTVTP